MKKYRFYLIVIAALLSLTPSISKASDPYLESLDMQLPFESGSTWNISCGYQESPIGDCKTHAIGIKDEFALDFNMGTSDCGKSILAVASGNIIAAVSGSAPNSYGNYVEINHGNGYSSFYAHLQSITVSAGQSVVQGQIIGYCGKSGTESCHLHFAVYKVNSEGKRWSIPPEPMSGYYNFVGSYQENYTSLNTYNPNNNYRIGKFSDGWKIEPWGTSFDGYFAPYSRPFAITYFHNGGLNTLGHPDNTVHLLTSLEAPGLTAYGSPACYVQNIRNTSGGEAWLTLVLNPYVYNVRMKYMGVVYPIHGQIRDYWRLNYSRYGPPVSNEYFDYVNGVKYVVQWFEPSDNNFVKITYNTVNGVFNDTASVNLDFGDHLDQSVLDNLGCTSAQNCGVGGGEEDPPPADDPNAAILGQPQNLRVVELGENLIRLTWDAVTGADSYKVLKNDICSFFTSGQVTFTDNGMQPGETVNYKVWAFKSPYYSANCAEINATSIPIGPFTASFTASATSGPAPLTVEFVNTSTGGPTDYFWELLNGNIYLGPDRNITYTFAKPGVYTMRLEIYRYRIWSNYYMTITVTEPNSINPPTGLTVTDVTTDSIGLSWNETPNAAGYKLYRDHILIKTLTAVSYTDTGLSDDTSVCYTVVAYVGNVESISSKEVS